MQAGLEARHLTKYYSAIPAIRDVSLTLEPGTVLGLLGPNGSGKSTTVSILTGLREPSTGQIRFNGHNIADHLANYKARVGYVPDRPELRSAFFIVGPHVAAGRSLGEIDMRRIAPTLAGIMGFSLRDADLNRLSLE